MKKSHKIEQKTSHFNLKILHTLMSILGLFLIAVTTIALAALSGTSSNGTISGVQDNNYGYGLETDGSLYVRINSGTQNKRENTTTPITNGRIEIDNEVATITLPTAGNAPLYNIFIPTRTSTERTKFKQAANNLNLNIELTGTILSPTCGETEYTCKSGQSTNNNKSIGSCGISCKSTESKNTYTWKCGNGSKIVSCTSSKCESNKNCGGANEQK